MTMPRDAKVVTNHRIARRYRTEGCVGSDTMILWQAQRVCREVLREQRIRRMNLQLLRHCIGARAASKVAGYLLAVWIVGAGLNAWAQLATRTHLSVTSEARGTTFTAKVGDIAGNPANGGT